MVLVLFVPKKAAKCTSLCSFTIESSSVVSGLQFSFRAYCVPTSKPYHTVFRIGEETRPFEILYGSARKKREKNFFRAIFTFKDMIGMFIKILSLS